MAKVAVTHVYVEQTNSAGVAPHNFTPWMFNLLSLRGQNVLFCRLEDEHAKKNKGHDVPDAFHRAHFTVMWCTFTHYMTIERLTLERLYYTNPCSGEKCSSHNSPEDFKRAIYILQNSKRLFIVFVLAAPGTVDILETKWFPKCMYGVQYVGGRGIDSH